MPKPELILIFLRKIKIMGLKKVKLQIASTRLILHS